MNDMLMKEAFTYGERGRLKAGVVEPTARSHGRRAGKALLTQAALVIISL